MENKKSLLDAINDAERLITMKRTNKVILTVEVSKKNDGVDFSFNMDYEERQRNKMVDYVIDNFDKLDPNMSILTIGVSTKVSNALGRSGYKTIGSIYDVVNGKVKVRSLGVGGFQSLIQGLAWMIGGLKSNGD